MSMDTPAKIAILGAGPIGLEAALYARFLGFEVEVFDRGEVGENVRRWGHVRMFSPFRMNASSLGLDALHAHDDNYVAPASDAILTGHDWLERYLRPLSQTDLVADHIRTHTTVTSVLRREFPEWAQEDEKDEVEEKAKDEEDEACAEEPMDAASAFQIRWRDRDGRESDSFAEVVIDATGVFAQPNGMGPDGKYVPGEQGLCNRIRYDVPDIDGLDGPRYANRRVLVIGSGHSAATSVLALARLTAAHGNTRITWMVRPQATSDNSPAPLRTAGPLPEIADDPLIERANLVRAANALAMNTSGPVSMCAGSMVRAVAWNELQKQFVVELTGSDPGSREFDEIIANVGCRADNSIYAEMHIDARDQLEIPGKYLAHPVEKNVESLPLNPAPNLYILGAASFERGRHFLVWNGLQHIRALFQVIGGRAALNLYK